MKIFMLGTSGLVGSTCYSKLLLEKSSSEIVTFTRRRLNLHGGIERIGDLNDMASLMEGLEAEVAFCAVGTTIKKAKTRAAFEEVDLNLPLRFACAARDHGVKSFHLVSALGADASSSQTYLRTKGVLENELKSIGFPTLHIYQPSLLIGQRTELRIGEELVAGLYRRFHALYPKALNKYRPIEVEQLSRFIIRKIMENSPGTQVWTNEQMISG
ncbi:MAG: NAD-dependent epimerase/dehydratase family protein [Chitinophagaceae bacterium]|nr:NAD-dependent epimerase/dehydratase family protein [Oligoflexus sp.]